MPDRELLHGQLRAFLTLLHPPQTDVSRCGSTHIPNGNAAPARTPDPRRAGLATKNTTKDAKNTLSYTLQDTLVVLTSRITAADNSSSACRSGSRACAVPPRRASCRGGCVRLRSICPAVTRSARFARDVVNRSGCSRERVRGFV